MKFWVSLLSCNPRLGLKLKPQIWLTLQIIRLFILSLSKWLIFQAIGSIKSGEKLFKEILPFFAHKVSFCFPYSFILQRALYSLPVFWIMNFKWIYLCIVYLQEISLCASKFPTAGENRFVVKQNIVTLVFYTFVSISIGCLSSIYLSCLSSICVYLSSTYLPSCSWLDNVKLLLAIGINKDTQCFF